MTDRTKDVIKGVAENVAEESEANVTVGDWISLEDLADIVQEMQEGEQ